MNQSPSNSDNTKWESDGPDNLQATLQQMRTDEPPQDSVQRVVSWAVELDNQEPVTANKSLTGTTAGRQRTQQRSRFSRLQVVLAASVAVVLMLSLGRAFQPSAWAQVVEAVGGQSWIRLTLQPPMTPLPEGESASTVRMWFRGDQTVAAIRSDQQTAWINLAQRDKYEFQPEAGRVVLSKLGARESSAIQSLLAALAPFQPDSERPQDLKLTGRTEVSVDDHTYVDFAFRVAGGNEDPAPATLTVRVDKSNMLPTELLLREARFQIDYPTAGPNDIYALNIPAEAELSDLRNLETYFREREVPQRADYEAVELTFFAWQEGRQPIEAARYRADRNNMVYQRFDATQLRQRSQEPEAGSQPETLDAWVDRLAEVDAEAIELDESNFPHHRCYRQYGGVESYDSATVSTLPGLEGTIEIHGPQQSVWLDPTRDLAVRRWEKRNEQNRSIHVVQIDEVAQGPNGVWFATRWRQGEVSERGGELSSSADRASRPGVATTVHIARIEFK